MAALYDGDNNRIFQIDNTYKWEDCYGDDVLIPKSERTENGDSPMRQAYTYEESGESSYYMYDGRGSVTGLVTDSGHGTTTRRMETLSRRMRRMASYHSR